MTMCNVWLSVDYTTARAYASTAFLVPTEVGMAILFSDGSVGYMTVGDGWRGLLTRARRDDMLNSMRKRLDRMERNWLSRLFTAGQRTNLLAQIHILERAL
jgi:hypothetical protein